MCPAGVLGSSVSSIGNMLSANAQAQAQYQQASYLSQLQAMREINSNHPLAGLQNAAPTSPVSAAWAQAKGRRLAEEGYRLIERIYFWAEFGVFARWFVERLADRLARLADEAERHLAVVGADHGGGASGCHIP